MNPQPTALRLLASTLACPILIFVSAADAVTLRVEPNGTEDGPFTSALHGGEGHGSGATTDLSPPHRPGISGAPVQTRVFSLKEALALAATNPRDEWTIRLEPGHHWLTPESVTEPTCGNCEDPQTPVPLTVGAVIQGRNVRVIGADEHRSVVHTRSGYGLLVQDCLDCEITGLVITDGVRDTSQAATDAAIVVQRSKVRIENNVIRDNIGDPRVIEEKIVGIIGIAGREGARMTIENNRILRNSWDGIALYRDAEAEIQDNEIDGIDLALGRTAGGGRGVGIGLTWNAKAKIRGNRVSRYWKGIGIFVDAQALVEDNVVERIATWGLSLWDAGRGRPSALFRHNVVDSTGACGISIVRADSGLSDDRFVEGAGEIIGNVISRTGQNPKYDDGEPYCFQTAIALHAVPDPFPIEDNLLLENRGPQGRPGSGDADPLVAARRLATLTARLSGYEATSKSHFLRRMGLGNDSGWGRR